MKYFLFLLALATSLVLQAQSLVIESSRTSGTAPLYVFFDATSSTGLDGVNDLPNADFLWDFDLNNTDPTGKWELTKIGSDVTIISVNGQEVVRHFKLNQNQLNVSHIPPGLYVLKVEGDGKYLGKFIKN